MLIDQFMPEWDAVKSHEIIVEATPSDTLAAVRKMDLGGDWLVAALLRIRGFRRPPRGWGGLAEAGFIQLGETDCELLVGIVGRFWTPSGGLRPLSPAEFAAFGEPNHAKATWNFAVATLDNGFTKLSTETRILCTDDHARRRFRAYWRTVGPFSGLIRMRALKRIKAAVEST